MTWRQSHTAAIVRRANLDAFSAAIVADPDLMLECLSSATQTWSLEDIEDLLIPIVATSPGLYERLPWHIAERRDILFAALEGDLELQAEFLETADKEAIQAWQACDWCSQCRSQGRYLASCVCDACGGCLRGRRFCTRCVAPRKASATSTQCPRHVFAKKERKRGTRKK